MTTHMLVTFTAGGCIQPYSGAYAVHVTCTILTSLSAKNSWILKHLWHWGSDWGTVASESSCPKECLRYDLKEYWLRQPDFNYFWGCCQHLNLCKVKLGFNSLRILTPRLLKLSSCIWTCPIYSHLVDLLVDHRETVETLTCCLPDMLFLLENILIFRTAHHSYEHFSLFDLYTT